MSARSKSNGEQKAKRFKAINLEDDDKKDTNSNSVTEPLNGIIEEITLKHFMCHSHLKFEFGPNINFITGVNGSGKSAIVIGLMVALGSRASNTGRSQNLNAFIQTGERNATIKVVLRNTGSEAFKPDVYGNKITIERNLFSDGKSTYKLIGRDGAVISDKKDQLNKVLSYLNIQADNPVCILTQDASKTLLEAADPKKKYEFFFRVSQLEKIKENYTDVKKKKILYDERLNKKKESLKEIEKSVEEIQKDQKKFQRQQNERTRIKQLQDELMWAKAKEMRAHEKTLVNEANKINSEIQALEENSKRFNNKVNEYNKLLKNLCDEKQNLLAEINQLEKSRNDLDQKFLSSTAHYKENKKRLDAIKNEISNLNLEINEKLESLKELNQRSHHDSDMQVNEEKLKDLEENHSRLKQLSKQNFLDCSIIDDDIFQKKSLILCLETSIEEKKNEEEHCIKNISIMKEIVSNEDLRYDQKMPHLRHEIAKAKHAFKKQPIGPLGMFVKVKDKKWALAIEICITKSLLHGFCCDNVKDAETLKNIMKTVYCGSYELVKRIITCEFSDEIYPDIENVQSKYPTVYDAIVTTNSTVMNCLIDQKRIENILLIEDTDCAMNVMSKNPPKGCIFCCTKNGDQIYPSPNFRFYSNKSSSSKCLLMHKYDQANIECEVEKLKHIQDEIKALEKNKLEEKKFFEKLESDKKSKDKISQDLKREISLIGKSIEDIKESLVTSNNWNTEKLGKVIDEMKKTKIKFENEAYCLQSESEEKKSNAQVFESQIGELDNKKTNLDQKLKSKTMEIDAKNDEKRSILKERRDNQASLTLKKENFAKCSDGIKTYRKTIVNHEKVCEFLMPIDTTRTSSEITRELTETQKVLTEQEGADYETILKKIYDFKKLYEKSSSEIKYLEELLKRIDRRLQKGLERFKNLQDTESFCLLYTFTNNLVLKGLKGELVFNHDDCTLNIYIKPSGAGKAVNINSLSGGERSSVTVAFLMALADVSGVPFHILDEYDVFMDPINKEKSLEIVLAKAKEQTYKQFIFLTPTSLPSFIRPKNSNPNIKIVKMPDPIRK